MQISVMAGGVDHVQVRTASPRNGVVTDWLGNPPAIVPPAVTAPVLGLSHSHLAVAEEGRELARNYGCQATKDYRTVRPRTLRPRNHSPNKTSSSGA